MCLGFLANSCNYICGCGGARSGNLGELMKHRLVLFNCLHRVSVADVEIVFQEGLMQTIIGYGQDKAVCASSLILDAVA